ncbi:hypothetical protein PG993_004621 [Apiospora rasikravindrae]|uniref:ubiquitinyl hydrolase 1 n=1 Tax=Apiospora rasikravindrae TaxID=990691 RepID=A0ABR1TDA4_9PEZI
MSAKACDQSALLYQIDHVFLPRKLPQEDDFAVSNDRALTNHVLDVLRRFEDDAEGHHVSDVRRATQMVSAMLQCRTGRNLHAQQVCSALNDLADQGALCFQLTAQNFGLLITRQDQTVHFEQFELLARNKDVMACQGRLLRSFPSNCIAMQYSLYKSDGFTSALAQCLSKLDRSTHSSSRPKSQEQRDGDEERDTVDPRLSAMLNGLLRGLGNEADVVQIEKHSPRLPWHRSATWLLVRVSLQLLWSRNSEAPNTCPLFKGFIAYFVASCVNLAKESGVTDELLYCMLAKLDRRCQKLSQLPYFENNKPGWLDYCSDAQSAAIQYLEQRWTDRQLSDERLLPLEELESLSFPTDSALRLTSLREYLSEMQKAQAASSGPRESHGNYAFSRTSGIEPPTISTDKSLAFLTLANFETWVATSLSNWLEANVVEKSTCGRLSHMIEEYQKLASHTYKYNPFNLSVMWLSILELWVACDEAATHQISLLLDYGSEIPPNLLQVLVLPSLHLMKRLHVVESHLRKRQAAKPGRPSIFSAFGDPNSFAVQFYSDSPHHQLIHKEIVAASELKASEKTEELVRKKTEYQQLQHEYDNISHQKQQVTHDVAMEDAPAEDALAEDAPLEETCIDACPKCGLEKRMTEMRISVYESPLPSDECEAKAVVFELQVPEPFAAWRCSTLRLLADGLKPEDSASCNPVYNLWSTSHYSELLRYQQNATDRLQILSASKPFTEAQGHDKLVSEATKEFVCAPHGCRYAYYDRDDANMRCAGRLCSRLVGMKLVIPPCCSFASLSTFPLPHWIRGYTHTSNEVIAQQSDCPAYMTLESFKAFGHIRSGYRLQWRNILAQLAMPSVDFNQVETALVILQAINEAGPCADEPSSELRDAHRLLNGQAFALSLVEALRAAYHRVCQNWECDVAMLVLACICTRLLCTSRDQGIRQACGKLLTDIRFTTRNWALSLADRADEPGSENEADEFNHRALAMSLACSSTFSVGRDELELIFFENDSVTTFLEVSYLIHTHRQSFDQRNQHENQGTEAPAAAPPGDLKPQYPLIVIAMQSWHRICYLFQPFLTERIEQTRVCLDKAIGTFWAAYTPGKVWTQGSRGYQHIMTSSCCSSTAEKNPLVTFDLFEGLLLVDGRPLSRLPSQYYQNSTFKRLFGELSPKVSPSNEFDMDFTAVRQRQGWMIHFAMKDERLVDFVPSDFLKDDLPESLIIPYSHWVNFETGILELRPWKYLWCSERTLWRADTTLAETTLANGDKVLIDSKSSTAKCICGILGSLESPSFITILLDKAKSELVVDLPRYDLTFTLKPGTSVLQCTKYPGMCVDSVQSVGSLIGLESKLVLRPQYLEASRRRTVIVPYGTPHVQGDHVSHPVTSITPAQSQTNAECVSDVARYTHLYYETDTILGRLVDNGSLRSKLLLCHLHATTSYCLADPLTSRTGTEEALRILKSAAVVSFPRLDPMDAETLFGIAQLSPVRNFYPGGDLMEMQRINWKSTLHPLAQNDEFRQVVKTILQHAESCEAFFHPPKAFRMPQESNTQLVDRALIRDSVFRVDGFGAEHFTSARDCAYLNRDIIEGSSVEEPEQRFCHVTKLLLSRDAYLVEPLPDVKKLIFGIYMVLRSEVLDRSHRSDIPFGGFDIQWLDEPAKSIGQNWRVLHHYLTTVNASESKFNLMTLFGALIFAPQADFAIIQLLLALVFCPDARRQLHPQHSMFKLTDGQKYDQDQVLSSMQDKHRPREHTPEWRLPQNQTESKRAFNQRRKAAWQAKLERVKHAFESPLHAQFPLEPRAPVSREIDVYINVEGALNGIRELFRSWSRNKEFNTYLNSIVDAAIRLPISPYHVLSCSFSRQKLGIASQAAHVTAHNIFLEEAPELRCQKPFKLDDLRLRLARSQNANRHGHGPQPTSQPVIETLHHMAKDSYEKQYVKELSSSFENYDAAGNREQFALDFDTVSKRLQSNTRRCGQEVEYFQSTIFDVLERQANRLVPHSKHFFPRLSPLFVLQQLNRNHWLDLPGPWRSCITQYALAITHMQRSQRMLGLVRNKLDLKREAENVGHSWELERFPDSLLMEVESGLIIRDVQEEVAKSMREPDGNRVMQLNMGEGKSSVIVQMVAAHLADGKRLVRVIVAKPQSKQMRHMLVTKLGGLLDRRVFFLPFSRAVTMDESKVAYLETQFQTCQKEGGILLVQPEELLSLKLMGLEQVGTLMSPIESPNGELGTNMKTTGHRLLELQKHLETHSRDIIDESDENFSVKFELVYTIGTQTPTDMSPDRWIVVQHVLTLVARFAPEIKQLQPDGIQLQSVGIGQFPLLRFLHEESGRMLLEKVANHIRDNGCHCFPISHQSQEARDLIFSYITQLKVDEDVVKRVGDTESDFFNDMTRKVLLLLRGLFAHGILSFAFGQKRWRVNYGLTTRTPPTMLAVPYRAKDSPAPRSEFSHPDVALVLTCMSYYYGGLSDAEMDTAFEHLERSDQSSTVYGEWVAGSPSLEPAFHQLSGVNCKDRSQCLSRVFPALRRTKAVVDYYLSKVVFPRECLEFPSKLSASGWDLAKPRPQAVTGFSGTCDSKYVLPTDISHVDLPSQMHTNATVLSNLLCPDNTVKLLGQDLSSEALLTAVAGDDVPIQVILDVGALIVDLENDEVARKWLEEAVIFLNREDEMLVMDRNGFVEPFLTSSFAANTEACLVFLDEAHTRGIDLKLPGHYRAATTLGPKLTKDRLVQACMRMRKLGNGQSVVFLVPCEIQEKINAVRPVRNAPIQVSDVLCWSISETWADTRRSVPLWALQGLRHQRQETIWQWEIEPTTASDISGIIWDDLKDYFESETMSLEQRYCPRAQDTSNSLPEQLRKLGSSRRSDQVKLIQAKCEQFGVTSLASAALQEESERELACEIDEERDVQKPDTVQPLKHQIHPRIRTMVTSGVLRVPRTPREAIERALHSLRGNSGVSLEVLDGFGQSLLVTTDFCKAVELEGSSNPAAFQRSVQWVLTFKKSPALKMVILSPFEANELLPQIEKSRHVFLHMYLPRANLAMASLQHLKLHVVPSLPDDWEAPSDLVMRLNLFAGQLYFESFEEYKRTCAFLGLSTTPNEGSAAVAIDGFVGQSQYPDCLFKESPTSFLHHIMANVRRDRQDINRTHVGRMLTGEILSEADFQYSSQ